MAGIRKRTIAVFVVGFILGILAGARMQTELDLTVWPPNWIGNGASSGGNVVFTTTGGGDGQQKIDTTTFNVTGTFTVTWNTTGINGNGPGGFTTINLAGHANDLIAFAATHGSVLERHADCSQGCWFTVHTTDAKFTIQVLQ